MDVPTELIASLNKISSTRSISPTSKIFMKDNLDVLQEYATKEENKLIKPIVVVLDKGRLTESDKKLIICNKKSIIKLINKYEEEFNVDPNEDVIDDQKTVDEVEAELDAKIDKYNSYNKTHPMLGVSFNEKKNTWRYRTTETSKMNKDRKIIIGMAKEEIVTEKELRIFANGQKDFFNYQNHHFMVYWHAENPYFDIQHIISILNLKDTCVNHKYSKTSKHITNYMWHKNEFGGYILRELIPEKAMFEIILNSNSKLSKSFKTDVAQILSDLRKEGNLVITNDAVTKKLKKHANIDEESDAKIKELIDKPITLSYDNTMDMTQLYLLINQITFIALTEFLNQSVLYAFIVSLKRDHTDVIVKFGWSLDILARIKKLHTTYGSNFYLIGIKKVKNETIEKNFHAVLKQKFPDSIEKVSIKDKNKVELYKFNLLMMNEFNGVEEDYSQTIQNVALTSVQQNMINLVKNQASSFQMLIMAQLNLNNIMSKTKNETVIITCAQLHYGFLTLQTNNMHLNNTKKIEADAKIRELEINKEIESIKASVELRKADVRMKELELKCLKLSKKSKK